MKLSKLFDRVWNEKWSKDRYQNSGHATNVESLYRKHIAPEFGGLPAAKIKRSKIRRWHDSFVNDVYSGNRSLSLLKTLYSYAEQYEILALPQGNPTRGIKPHPEVKRERYATEKELATIKAYLKTDRDKDAANYVRILMMTGARPRSLSRISQIKPQPNGFGEAKYQGKCHDEKLIFSPDAMKIWKSAKAASYVRAFKLWKRMQEAHPKLKDLWMRDLRRTFATIGLSKGIPLDHIGQLLNHKNPQITLRYAKLLDQSRNKAIKQITDAIGKI